MGKDNGSPFGDAKPQPGYWRQLDGLRAFSVAAVAWSHWRMHWFHTPSLFPGAELGVETFFVISGFLITGILLDNRVPEQRSEVLKAFYCRRFLRIFPLFYATIAIALCLGVTGLAGTWYWHVGYLSNVYFYYHDWFGQFSHFWSLAVEEQFYLGWPLLILVLRPRFLLPVVIGCILGAPFYAWFTNATHTGVPGTIDAAVLMPSCLSALGMGALIACLVRVNRRVRRMMQWALAVGVAVAVGWHMMGSPAWLKPFNRLGEDCVIGWLVFSAADGIGGPVGWILDCRPVRYLGKISYGLYIIHGFADGLLSSGITVLRCPSWVARLCEGPLVRVSLLLMLTVGLASFSWYCFEGPINRLKRHFPYPVRVPAVTGGTTARTSLDQIKASESA